jgi:hypothetical protein
VPSEYVTGLLSGRAVEAEVGQPYTRGGSVVFPVAVRCADAMKRLKSVGIAAWVGEASDTPRAPGDTHATKPGDASYKEVSLTYDKETRIATGEVEFPKQADGRAYWIQPYFSNALVSKWFTAGTAVKVKSPPVDKVAGTLVPKYPLGTERKVSIEQKADFTERTELGGKELYRKDLLGQILKVTEAVDKPTGSGNYATLNHSLESLVMLYKQFDQEAELPKSIREVTSGLSRWSSSLTVSKQGSAGVTQPPSHNPGPDAARQDMFKRFAAQLQHLTQATLIPLPGKQVQPGEAWGENRIHRFVLEQDHLLQDRPAAKDEHRGHLVREEIVYTYLGRRDRNGRGELVVQVTGVLHPTNAPAVVVGIVTGTAILNEADGDLRELELKREFDLDTSHGGAVRKAVGTETYKMTREK